MTVVHRFDSPDRFVAGTVGEPGARTFFLQAREGARLVSVALEKQQVALLAERVDELLDEVMRQVSGAATVIPAVAPHGLEDREPLDQPITPEFRVGTMTLSWDVEDDRLVLEIFSIDEADVVGPGDDPDDGDDGSEEDGEPAEALVVRLDAAHARAFVQRAELVVDAGRPACPFCGLPIDPEGHLCVRANGFRRREPLADEP